MVLTSLFQADTVNVSTSPSVDPKLLVIAVFAVLTRHVTYDALLIHPSAGFGDRAVHQTQTPN